MTDDFASIDADQDRSRGSQENRFKIMRHSARGAKSLSI